MDEKNFEEIADRERERAAQEISDMQNALKSKHKQLDKQQKNLTKKVMNENLDEHSAKKSTVWIFVLLIAILAGSYFSLTVYKPRMNYKKAEAMLEKGNFDGAKNIFSQLGNYDDAYTMVKECDYRKGSYLLASEKYNQALAAFANVRGYKDRDRMVADLAGTAEQTLDTSGHHSAFVRSIGTVKAVGDNSAGQCNVGDWRDIRQIACGDDFTVGLTSSGGVVCTNAVVDWQDIRQITAGANFFAGLDGSGRVRFYGMQELPLENVKKIDANNGIFAALKNDGTVAAVGADTSAWSGIADIVTDGKAVYGLRSDGTIASTDGRLTEASGMRCISAAINTVTAIDSENNIYAEGVLQAEAFKNTLLLAGDAAHAIMLLDDGYVKYIGEAENGSDNVGDWTDVLFIKKQR